MMRIMAALIGAGLLLFGGSAEAYEHDRYDPDIVSGDWIQPADILFVGDSEGLGDFGADVLRIDRIAKPGGEPGLPRPRPRVPPSWSNRAYLRS